MIIQRLSLQPYLLLCACASLWLHVRPCDAYRQLRTYPSTTYNISALKSISCDDYDRYCLIGSRNHLATLRVSGAHTHAANFVPIPLDASLPVSAHISAVAFYNNLLYLIANTHLDVICPEGEFTDRIALHPPLSEKEAIHIIDLAVDDTFIHILYAPSDVMYESAELEWHRHTHDGTRLSVETIVHQQEYAYFLLTHNSTTAVVACTHESVALYAQEAYPLYDPIWSLLSNALVTVQSHITERLKDPYLIPIRNVCLTPYNTLRILTPTAVIDATLSGDITRIVPLRVTPIHTTHSNPRIAAHTDTLMWLPKTHELRTACRHSKELTYNLWQQYVYPIDVHTVYDITYEDDTTQWLLLGTSDDVRVVRIEDTRVETLLFVPQHTRPPYTFIHGKTKPIGFLDRTQIFLANDTFTGYHMPFDHLLPHTNSPASIVRLSAISGEDDILYVCARRTDADEWFVGSDVHVFTREGTLHRTHDINAGDLALMDDTVTALTARQRRGANIHYEIVHVSASPVTHTHTDVSSSSGVPLAHTHAGTHEILLLYSDGYVRTWIPRQNVFFPTPGLRVQINARRNPALPLYDDTTDTLHIHHTEWDDTGGINPRAQRRIFRHGRHVHTRPSRAYERLRQIRMRRWPRLNVHCDFMHNKTTPYTLHLHGGARRVRATGFQRLTASSAGMPAPVRNIIVRDNCHATITVARVNNIRINGDFSGHIRTHVERIKRLHVANNIRNASIHARGNIGIIRAGNTIHTAHVYAGKRDTYTIGMSGAIRHVIAAGGIYNSSFIACALPGANGNWWDMDAVFHSSVGSMRVGRMRDDEHTGGGVRPGVIADSLIVTKSPVNFIMGNLEGCIYIVNGITQ